MRLAASRSWHGPAAAAVPLFVLALGVPAFLQQPLRAFDDGLYLTLARFTGPDHLPYRDLWTLYGPGPSVYAALIDQIAGSGLLAARVGLVGIQVGLVTGVYALARRFVPAWIALGVAVVPASFGYLHNHYHFAMSLALLAWGLWLLDRGRDRPEPSRTITAGLVLVGMSFAGRYELAPVAGGLVLLLWLAFRGRIGTRSWVALAAGLAPVALFAGYLLLVVGWDRAYENLIDYPRRYYALPGCRGTPSAWPLAADALAAVTRGRLWTGTELTLWAGTYLPPIVALAAIVSVVRRYRDRTSAAIALSIAVVCVLVWVEQRPRAGSEPHPTWPFLLLTGVVLLSRLRGRARAVAGGAVVALIASIVLVSWAPEAMRAWGTFPPAHPLYGYARSEVSGLLDEGVWARIRREVQRRVPPGDEIFVALSDNTGTFANLAAFYWLTDRAPASRFFELDPCLTDRADVQEQIVADLQGVDIVIVTPYFMTGPPPVAPPTDLLDDYLAVSFRVVHEEQLLGPGDVAILERFDR